MCFWLVFPAKFRYTNRGFEQELIGMSMDYLLLSEVEVRSVVLSEKQLEMRRALQRIISEEDSMSVAKDLLDRKLVKTDEIIEMMKWIKENREDVQVKSRFKSLNRRGVR